MSDDISSKVKKIVADHLGIEEAKVTDESRYITGQNIHINGGMLMV